MQLLTPSLCLSLSLSVSLLLPTHRNYGGGGAGVMGEKTPHQPQGLLIKSNMFSHFFGNLITQNAYLGATGGNKLRQIKNVLRSSKHIYVNAYYPINVHQHQASAHNASKKHTLIII